MKSNSCQTVENVLWRYIDRELPARELGTVTQHLQDCESCRKVYEERAKESRFYRLAFTDSPFGEGFVDRYRNRADRDNLAELYSDRREEDRGRGYPLRHQKVRRFMMVAAMILLIPTIVVIGMIANRGRSRPLGVCWVQLEEPGGSIVPVNEPSVVKPGTVFEDVPEGASLLLTLSSRRPADLDRAGFDEREADDGEAWLEISGPAKFETRAGATVSSFSSMLHFGKLQADVGKRGQGESFEVWTPHGKVAVVGTRFRLHVSADETRLLVEEGAVDFRKDDFAAVEDSIRTSDDGWYRIRRHGSRPEPVEPGAADSNSGGGETTVGNEPPPSAGEERPSVETTGTPDLIPGPSESSRPDLDTPVTPLPNGSEKQSQR